MGKYSSPLVSFTDVSACLPALEQPVGWRIALYPAPRNSTLLLPAVELIVTRRDGSTYVFKRWGSRPKTGSLQSTMAALLQAAHEASWWCEGRSTNEVSNLAQWESDARLFRA